MRETSPALATNVIDASLAIRVILPIAPVSDAPRLVDEWRRAGVKLVAPMLWLPESVSAIRGNVSAGAVSAESGLRAIDDLFNLGVETVAIDVRHCRSALEWAGRIGQMSAYDSFYLALAERLRAPLWTADKRLANAARRAGVTWVRAVGERGA